ncbi:chitobiase/beta-hexosaminidase C-terminal domain-containing protein [Paenibacillus sp. HN-1]|uniref:OmpL47-type beta-barrel domain-containing protein n=1 Tax=Paenibacillus TaxID=44249 RepID=UPI001CAA1DF1|nr:MULTISPECIES: LamG-like jellyroll fold domain-containing protein [Paenibacillus]MBY9080678.1 chitobiase/beta-hexosaminidase C-terminal domain-containing protein [Paenibacillus sp. CGMCC 1.18879]MBY9085377.1 chitobiase/beta-hexosaminidase C-terminal domain-containing protein [Paenibacillus sinensis]
MRLWNTMKKPLKRPMLTVMIASVFIGGYAPTPYVHAAAGEEYDSVNLVAHYPLNNTYKEQNKLNPSQMLSSSSPSWNADYVSLVNPGNANDGHIAGPNPANAVTGKRISFSLDIKLNMKQTRSTSGVNTLLSYGADNNNNLTLRPYYSAGKAAVVLKRNGTDVAAAAFPSPAADMWHNYTISLDGTAGTGKLIVWVDGVKAAEVGSAGIGADEIGNGQIRLNRTIATYSNLDSHYRDVRVFKDALDQSAADYFAGEIREFTWNNLLALKPLTDGMEVRGDLSLLSDPHITWTSSDTNVINPDTGSVNRPARGTGVKEVTLTMNWFNYSQAYKVKVAPLDASDDLIASFNFDDPTSGLAGGGAKAAVQGTASYTSSFEGNGQAANIGSGFWLNVTKADGTPLLAGLKELTISYDSKPSGGSGWVFFAAPNTNTQTYLNERYLGVLDTPASVTVERYNNSGARPQTAQSGSGTEWKHVDVVITATESRLYIDGELKSTAASSLALTDILTTSGGILQIGKGNWGSGEYYAGLIDNLQIFNKALTPDDLTEFRIRNVSPVISPDAGQIYGPVTITHPAGNKYIYYTTDGTAPTLNSTPYTGPFEISGDVTVKAAAIAPSGISSAVASVDYYGSEWSATANEFRLDGEDTVNNVKISWPVISGTDYYEVYRGDALINRTNGDTVDEYGLETDKDYSYTVKAIRGGEQIALASTNTVHTFSYDPSAITQKKDNYTGADNLSTANTYGIKVGSTWYHYTYTAAKNAATGIITTSIYELTGGDGHSYGNDRLLGSFEDMRVESAGYSLNPKTGKVVFTAHEEASSGYTRAAIFLGSVTPGGNDFAATFRGRPFDKDSRDMSLFVDDDNRAYILFATRNNNDTGILELDGNWEQPKAMVNTVFVGKHKESPTMIKYEGRYYFFASTTNGWYPSQAEYASAESLAGQWTPLRAIGNGSMYATQANGAVKWTGANGRVAFAENGYHWGEQYAENFKDPMGTYARLFPMVFHNGIATADWFHQLDEDPVHGVIPVQSGRYLSLGKKAVDSTGLDAAAVTDGEDLASSPRVQHSSMGYNIVIDLEQYARLSEINLTTREVNGSDTVYRYTLEGSRDNTNWTVLVDGSANNVVGFVTNPISNEGHYRYVRLTVNSVINVINGQSATWADGIIELAVFGTPYIEKSALEAKYNDHKDTVRGNYTNGTWSTITAALHKAETVLGDNSATQWDADRAALQIDEAFNWAQTVHPGNVTDYSSAGVPVGETWYDTEGNPIQAHGGGFLQQTAEDGRPIYYWVGENKIHNRAAFYAVSLYSSRDLVNWTNEGNILDQFADTVQGAEYGLLDAKWERPKLVYNDKTKKYVLYGHWETASSYASSQIAVAVADRPEGPYTFLGHWRPGGTLRNWRSDNGIYLDSEYYKTSGTKVAVPADVQNDPAQMGYVSRDLTVFTDDDGAAYLVSAEGHSMRVHRLNADYTDMDLTTYAFSDAAAKSADFESYSFYEDVGREAPAIVRAEDGYYMVSSGQSGWLPNQGTISFNADLKNPEGWTPVKENGLLIEKYAFGNNSTYYSQPTNIMKLTNEDGTKTYIYMGDRWRSSQLSDSRYVWLPITFSQAEHTASMSYTTGWKLNAATGNVQLPKVVLVSQGKNATITNNASVTGIEKANDGYAFNLRTSGDSTSFFGGLSAPYEYTVDLGDVYDLSRIDVAYRLYNGSEMYHRYQIYGSTDNQNWTELVNNNTNIWAGFNSDKLSGSYRYVKLKVNEVRRVSNDALSNSWGSGLVEVQIYSAAADQTPPATTDDAPADWVNRDVNVTLHAEDTESSVEATYFTVNGGPEQTGESISLSDEGTHDITYWSVDAAGNSEEPHSVQVKIDKTAPVTTAEVNPASPDGLNGWYAHPITVTLNAKDNLSGVVDTVYSLDNGITWQAYTAPISLGEDGQYELKYYSVDNAKNTEEAASAVSLYLDQTLPAIDIHSPTGEIYLDAQTVAVDYTVYDLLSGINDLSVAATLDGQPIDKGTAIELYKLSLGEHVLIVSVVDQAGNSASATVSFETTTSISSLEQLVNRFAADGAIDNQGIANSLLSKLQKNNLNSFRNEVRAQSGKHISAEAASVLLRDAEYLSE